ncbi:RNA polymerase sigma factor RpoH [Allofrancisella guangzhouensis]|uniref:RNA polymerase sigma factor RpoH n=1 Tax=Allofrancisella guangzhouensis TaxID=594679 RepID=L8BTA7_9GAMM|nr:RNA polymerase sigma factor RpoH [Allofrancisella guangzhouensis]AJC48804.1 RNA polymerase factor sigma-32 [Allofrancisella guangzhouensis]MBK2027145.1 RNA polymerase sigma factor RpoH [Allofrancisella guangzhouensis]MBK2044483.1 RNA polymerase sigma factor RpoH [Allofrancisella guangzhouensis]MBK2046028.1 RNA polymerase sigma factor RpoH [Allofrancisella guangzhouensis]CCO62147.1 RNA polymerase sigma factor RpoH [Allofrancisella guangzhouensis]
MLKKKYYPITTKSKTLPVVSDNNLNSYLNFVNSLPILSVEEEQELARLYKYKKDLDAAHQLVLAHLRFVTKIAKGFGGYGLSIADLIQEGNIGLMKAVSKFDPEQGVRLVSFAVHWIKAEMHDYVLKNWKIVKVATTKAQRKLFFNLRGSKSKVGWLTSEDIKQIADELGVKEETVIEMEKRMCQGDASLDLPYKDNEGEDTNQQSLHLEDKSSDIEHQAIQQDYYDNLMVAVREVLSNFDTRTKDIVMSRYLLEEKTTLQDLADKYKISAERVRQIEEEALVKLKKAVKNLS